MIAGRTLTGGIGRCLVFLALALATTTSSRTSSAFCRSTTNDKFEPSISKMCDNVGLPLYWATSCIGFSVQHDASSHPNLDLATVRSHVQLAFDQWSSVDCTDVGAQCSARSTGHPSIKAQDLGPAVCGCREFNREKGNANVIVFRDTEWAECDGSLKSNPAETIALTTMTYNPKTGEILDTDMEINTKYHEVTVGDARAIYDFDSILTHETGHVLGLAHTDLRTTVNANAPTMLYRYNPGDTFMRSLEQDDNCAICTVYPPNKVQACTPEPYNGFSEDCGKDQGCQCTVVGAGRSTPTTYAAFGGLALAGLAWRARRRRSGHGLGHTEPQGRGSVR